MEIAQNKRNGYTVRYVSASFSDCNSCVCADKLREALVLVKVEFLLGHPEFCYNFV